MRPYTESELQEFEGWAVRMMNERERLLMANCPRVTDLCVKVEAQMGRYVGVFSSPGSDYFNLLGEARHRCMDFQNVLREIPDEEAVEVRQVLVFCEEL